MVYFYKIVLVMMIICGVSMASEVEDKEDKKKSFLVEMAMTEFFFGINDLSAEKSVQSNFEKNMSSFALGVVLYSPILYFWNNRDQNQEMIVDKGMVAIMLGLFKWGLSRDKVLLKNETVRNIYWTLSGVWCVSSLDFAKEMLVYGWRKWGKHKKG